MRSRIEIKSGKLNLRQFCDQWLSDSSYNFLSLIIDIEIVLLASLMGSNICQAENRNTALFIDPDRKQNITEHPDEIFNTEFNDGTEAD